MVASGVGKTQRTGAQRELITLDFLSMTRMLGTTVIQAYVLLPLKEATPLLGANFKWDEIISEGTSLFFFSLISQGFIHRSDQSLWLHLNFQIP